MEKIKGSRKYLIFLTSSFPFGNGETFIENEIPYLAHSFNKVFILVPEGVGSKEKRPIPKNVILMPVQQGLNWHLRVITLFCQSFWHGLFLDLKRKNREARFFAVFKNCWHYFTMALQTKRAMQNTITCFGLEVHETILYSYWMDEKALGIGLVKKKMPAVKAISRAHGWDVYEERHIPPFLPFRPWLFKNLDKVVVVSKKGAEYLKEKYNPQEGEFVVSYLGTEKINEKRKTKNEKFTIVSCSNLIALKRVHLIIEALALIDQPVSWMHIGDGPLRGELEKKALKLFEGKDIDFSFSGQLTNKGVREIYETNYFDLFISSSETEGLPVSMMEAQSAAIPILATDVGGVNEIVMVGKTGWLLWSYPSPEKIAKKIEEIVKLPEEEASSIRQHSFRHWQGNFNAERNYKRFIEFLKDD